TTVNQSVKLHYQLTPKHKIYSGLTSSKSNNLSNNNPSNFISDLHARYFTIAYQFINLQLNNVLFPINSSFYVETNLGRRTSTAIAERQTQLTLNTYKIFSFNSKNSIFIRLDGKTLISNTYFENELLRLGGINSIRGFEENSLLADTYGIMNAEYRYQLTN